MQEDITTSRRTLSPIAAALCLIVVAVIAVELLRVRPLKQALEALSAENETLRAHASDLEERNRNQEKILNDFVKSARSDAVAVAPAE